MVGMLGADTPRLRAIALRFGRAAAVAERAALLAREVAMEHKFSL